MKAICILIFLATILIVSGTENSVNPIEEARVYCRDECRGKFDKVVCASWKKETRTFMGTCRMEQQNRCFNEGIL